MEIRKKFEEAITNQSEIKNLKGYVNSISENLIDGITVDLFEEDLMNGSGNELKSKFQALYSSAALAVNSFSIVKKNCKIFSFKGHSEFSNSNFEKQFRTSLGGTPPNLDFVIENNNVVVAFESKYLELLRRKEAKFSPKYNQENLHFLDSFWIDLINKYRDKKKYLDVAQLIKHSIGLINQNTNNRKIIFVYIYWTPQNYLDYSEYKVHKEELDAFANDLKKQSNLQFEYLTYNELWNYFDTVPEYSPYSKKLRNRYEIAIN